MGTRVLLADDSITIQKLVEMAFADTDFELLCVSDGKQAVDKLAAFQPQIILADAIMPIMDGYQVCEAVKANPITKDTPVILLTGRFQPYDEARAASVGIDERIVKPFVQDQLVELVQSFAPQDVDNTLDIEEPEDPITAPVEPVAEPIAEPQATAEEEPPAETDSGPTLDLDSHSTIRVKPGDIKQFLQEPEEDEVLELDEPSGSLDEMVLDEDDLEAIEEDDLEPLDSESGESLDDSFAASIDSINLDSGEEEQLDETLALGAESLDLPSFEADESSASAEEHVLDLDPEPEPDSIPAEPEDEEEEAIEEVNFEIQEEELEKTVKLSPEEMLDSIEQETLEPNVQPDPEPDPLANEVFELDPEIVPTASLTDEPEDLDLPSPEDFSSDSFEMESPSPVNIEPPSIVEEPEDLLDLDESQEGIDPIAEDLSDELPEIAEDSVPEDVLSLDQPDPDSIPTQSLDDLEDEPLDEHPEVDTGPIDDALNQTDDTDLDEDGFPDLEPLDELDDLPEPEPEHDPVMDLGESEEAPDFSEIEEPLLGDLSEESMATLDEHELSPEPEFEELEDFSTEESAEPLEAASTESVEDTASGMSFNPEQSLDLDEDPRGAKVSLDSNQMDYIVEAVAKRVVALLGEQTVREIAWEVIPELSEAMIKKRIYELEKTVDDE